MEKEVEEMLEGVVMFTTSILGILLNISSIFYFARYNHQRAFHRYRDSTPIIKDGG
jgi:Co/Zn/Cd efflux system component